MKMPIAIPIVGPTYGITFSTPTISPITNALCGERPQISRPIETITVISADSVTIPVK